MLWNYGSPGNSTLELFRTPPLPPEHEESAGRASTLRASLEPQTEAEAEPGGPSAPEPVGTTAEPRAGVGRDGHAGRRPRELAPHAAAVGVQPLAPSGGAKLGVRPQQDGERAGGEGGRKGIDQLREGGPAMFASLSWPHGCVLEV